MNTSDTGIWLWQCQAGRVYSPKDYSGKLRKGILAIASRIRTGALNQYSFLFAIPNPDY